MDPSWLDGLPETGAQTVMVTDVLDRFSDNLEHFCFADGIRES